MLESCDVLIIGAGPAGSSAAALIHAAGFSVQVVEKQRFPRFVIGESLLPRCMDLLDEAGLLKDVAARGYQIKRGALFLRGQERCDFEFSAQFTPGWDHTWQVPRDDFDSVLATAVAARGVPFLFEHDVKAVDLGESPSVTVQDPAGQIRSLHARFVVDASGYGRVLPRLLGLDAPSDLAPRSATFAHVRNDLRDGDSDSLRGWVVSTRSGPWLWVIPFSNGKTSVGVVGTPEQFAEGASASQILRSAMEDHPTCARRFEKAEFVFPPRTISHYSAKVKSVFGDHFCLVGNATEFLDPVFSSGVTLALESANLASKCVIRQLRGEPVDWAAEYAAPLKRGTDVFRTYVTAWYDGTLPQILFSPTVAENVKRMMCSVLAGYVWDQANPFVARHDQKVAQLARVVRESSFG